ncbi:MAG: hypothetical protein LBH32_05815 [Dysgonamonadaceae bacterium]|jgi:DNA-binding SARP family transcriptional activator|nr:hypothetical protein [Dysgonamonadaceae bacterium]
MADDNVYAGIDFVAHTEIKEKRTSLYLNPDRQFSLNEGIILSFDVELRRELHNYGYVFRLILDDEISFDLVANFSEKSKSLTLIENERIFLSFPQNILENYEWNRWMKITFSLLPDEVAIELDGNKLSAASDFYSGLKKCEIYFGVSEHKKFNSHDVPPMSVRNIKISDGQSLIACWLLKQHVREEVYDSVENLRAKTHNAVWKIDQHTKWKKEREFYLPRYIQVAYNGKENCIYMVYMSTFYKYYPGANKIDTVEVKKGNPYYEKNNQLVYNPYYGELWSYDMDSNMLSVFNEETREWSRGDAQIKNPNFSQHNAFISHVDSALYVFGGYGNYEYKNNLQRKKRNDNGAWENLNYKGNIPPRYLSGLGYNCGDSVFIFGGYGNEKGRQELAPKNYYDLYSVNFRTLDVSKVWEITPSENFVSGNSIVIDTANNRLYALCYPSNRTNVKICLKSFDLVSGEEKTYGDSIPFVFNDVNSFCTLYYSNMESKIYALTVDNTKDTAHVEVYSLPYPPLTDREMLQYPDADKQLTFVAITAFILALAIFFCTGKNIFRKRNNDRNMENREQHILKEPERSAIRFLGDFQVRDRQGRDITSKFTPVLKRILIAVVLYSEKNKKGISNTTLRNTLWADKSDEKAQNNRRVCIHRLKLLLEELDGVWLEKNDISWSVHIGNDFCCDYIYVCNFINKINNKEAVGFDELTAFPLNMLAEPLLPFIEDEWLDSFKARYSSMIIESMIYLSKQKSVMEQDEILRQIADIIFAHDRIDEYALKLKCRTLHRSGKTGMAKFVYDSFCAEYKSLLETDYPESFKETVRNIV